MLAIVGFLTIFITVGLIMSKKFSAVVSMTVVPIVAGIIIGQWGGLGKHIIGGIKVVSVNASMFAFSIIFFGIISDVGLFDVIVSKILRVVGADPLRICIATAVIAMMCHLDGAGATTFLITCGAMLPVYDKMKMKRINLAMITGISAGVMNFVPWGGPTMRAMISLDLTAQELFTPMLPVMFSGMICCIILAYIVGRAERKRLGDSYKHIKIETPKPEDLTPEQKALRRPKLFWVNLVLVIVTVVALLMGLLNNAAIFMLATAIALIINYSNPKDQRGRFDAHAANAMVMVSTIFAAGILSGVLRGSGMLEAMCEVVVSAVPAAMGSHLAVILGILAAPLCMFFDGESFLYVILPILGKTAEAYGISTLHVARAALTGYGTVGCYLSPLVGTTFMLMGLSKVELGDYQRHALLPTWGIALVELAVACALGLIAV